MVKLQTAILGGFAGKENKGNCSGCTAALWLHLSDSGLSSEGKSRRQLSWLLGLYAPSPRISAAYRPRAESSGNSSAVPLPIACNGRGSRAGAREGTTGYSSLCFTIGVNAVMAVVC